MEMKPIYKLNNDAIKLFYFNAFENFFFVLSKSSQITLTITVNDSYLQFNCKYKIALWMAEEGTATKFVDTATYIFYLGKGSIAWLRHL